MCMIELNISPFTSDPQVMKAMDRLTVLRAIFASKSDRGSGIKKLQEEAVRLGVRPEAIQHALAEKNNLRRNSR